jgi:uncharacterized protein (TIRG00374 family)
MRTAKTILFGLGTVLLVVLVYHVGSATILDALGRLTWWKFLLVCAPSALITAVDTLGWRFAFPRNQVSFARLYGARVAGEALNVVTALGSVGGEAVKAWLIRREVSYGDSIPAIVIAKTTLTIAQALFLAIGCVLAGRVLHVESSILNWMFWLLVVEVLAVAGFLGAQVSGLVARAGRVLTTLAAGQIAGHAETLDEALRRYYGSERRRFVLSVGCHLIGWLLGALETWLMLWALGLQTSPVTAIVVESLGSGVRFATFMVPANLGAFEGANAAAFVALGFGSGAGLAYSFVRRARQVVWVLVGIVLLVVMGSRRSQASDQPVAENTG